MLGNVTLITVFLSIIAFAIGYILVSSAKHSLKIIFILLVLVAGLYLIGLIPTEFVLKISTLYDIFKPFLASVSGVSSFVNMNLSMPLLALAAGAVFGWLKS